MQDIESPRVYIYLVPTLRNAKVEYNLDYLIDQFKVRGMGCA